jgi:hypothetical protein
MDPPSPDVPDYYSNNFHRAFGEPISSNKRAAVREAAMREAAMRELFPRRRRRFAALSVVV